MSRELELIIKIQAELDGLKKLNAGLLDNSKAIKEVEAAAKAAGEASASADSSVQALGAATEKAGAATDNKTDAEREAAESMKNLQGVGLQLTGALNGNISAMTKSIAVTPEFASKLQSAFSVLGAATFGYGIGTGIYKTFIEPLDEAKWAVNSLGQIAAESAAKLDQNALDNYVKKVEQITKAFEAQKGLLADSEAAMERSYGWAKNLLDVQYALLEQRVLEMPEGQNKERAQAHLNRARANTENRLEVETAFDKKTIAGEEANLANEALSAAKREQKEKLDRAKTELAGLNRSIPAQNEAVQKSLEKNGGNGWAGNVKAAIRTVSGLFDFDFKTSNALYANSARAKALRAQIKQLENDPALKALEDEKANSEKKFWIERENAQNTAVVAGKKNTLIEKKEEFGLNKADAKERKRQLEEQLPKITEEKEDVKKQLDEAQRGRHPLQLTAQREKGEMQTARDLYMHDNGNAGKKRNYERELAESRQAEQHADEMIAALYTTLTKLNARFKALEAKIKNLPIQ